MNVLLLLYYTERNRSLCIRTHAYTRAFSSLSITARGVLASGRQRKRNDSVTALLSGVHEFTLSSVRLCRLGTLLYSDELFHGVLYPVHTFIYFFFCVTFLCARNSVRDRTIEMKNIILSRQKCSVIIFEIVFLP